MRRFLSLVALLLAIGAIPGAKAQSLVGALPAVQNDSSTISFQLPEIPGGLLSWDLSIIYSSAVFENPSFASLVPLDYYDQGLPNSIDLSYFPSLADPDRAMLIADAAMGDQAKFRQVTLAAIAFAMPQENFPGGSLVDVTFKARENAELGDTKVFFAGHYGDASFTEYSFAATVPVVIAAVPEPHTWALMLAGIGAVLAWVSRRRNVAG